MEKAKNRIHFGRAVVDMVSKEEVLARVQTYLQEPRNLAWPAVIATVNAQFVHLAGRQPRFAAFLENADLSIADGMSLVFGSRLLGNPLPERITGVDLTEDLWALLSEQGGSVYLLGGKPRAAEETARRLKSRYPNVRFAGWDCPPVGFEKSAETAAHLLRRIQIARPDLLLVAFGAPKQEYWIEDNLLALPCKLVMGVGATFDMLSGQVRRAPDWMQKGGLEWLFRASLEPRRLAYRCLVNNSYFIWIVLCQLLLHWFHSAENKKVEAAQ